MGRIRPEYLDPDPSDHSVGADVLVREEEDEEEDGEEKDDEEEDDGYSELSPARLCRSSLVLTKATTRQVVLKPRVSVTEGEGRPPGRNQPRLVTPDTLLRIGR
jgi:hypothetical protein